MKFIYMGARAVKHIRDCVANVISMVIHLLSNPQDAFQRLGQRGRCCFCATCPNHYDVSCGLAEQAKRPLDAVY